MSGVMKREDIGMLKIGRDLDLAIDRSHPPATDLTLDLIAVSERGFQAFLVLLVG